MLSKRLKTISDMIDTNSVIDVGCDHALLDIYLTKYRNIKCLAIDCNENVIKKTLDNVSGLDIEVSLNDGLENILVKENQTVVIAGMGSKSIIDIVKDKKISNLIVQSNNKLDFLRKKITKMGYFISDEKIVYEKNKFYVVIKFKNGHKKYSFYDYLLGPIILSNKVENKKEYFTYLTNKYENIYQSYPKKYIFKRIRLKMILRKLSKECRSII